MNPLKIFVHGGKYILKGLSFILKRPETSIAALLLPGLGYAKIAMVLKYMIQAEDLFSNPGSGPTKLKYVISTLRKLEEQGIIDIGIDDGVLAKYIAALTPAAEGKAMLVEVESMD